MDKQTMKSLQTRLAMGAALVVLMLVGILAISAAPGKGSPTAAAAGHSRITTSARVAGSGTPTDTPTSAPAATATDTPQPPTATPTSTPAATATPTTPPAPTDTPAPTATPAPSWHTVGSYSGSAPGAMVTLPHVTGPVRITWTCAEHPDGTTQGVGFSFAPVGGGAGSFASGIACAPGNCTLANVSCDGVTMTGVWTETQAGDGTGRDWAVSENSTDAWTATVEVWY